MSDSANTRSAGGPRTRSKPHLEPLPLYPSEERIVREVFGETTCELMKTWRAAVPILERNGMPKRDPLMGNRRYWLAIRLWLDRYNGLSQEPWTKAPDGEENWSGRP